MNSKLRPLGWAAYAVAFLLVLMPLADTVLGVWPPRVGEVTWRFGAAGLISRAIMTPLFGMLVALTTAAILEHRVMARILASLSFVAAVLGVLAMIMFGLDALQARSGVRPEAISAFDIASTAAFLKYILGTITAVLLGIGGWKAGRKRHTAAAPATSGKVKEDDSRVLVSASE